MNVEALNLRNKNRSYRGAVRILQLKRQKRIDTFDLFDLIQVTKIFHDEDVIAQQDVMNRIAVFFFVRQVV